jgi:hypothetical protein
VCDHVIVDFLVEVLILILLRWVDFRFVTSTDTWFFLSCDTLEYGCRRLRVLVISRCRWNMGLLPSGVAGELKVGVEVKTRKSTSCNGIYIQ